MKLRNPKSRFQLNIPSSYRVLDVGGGHNPHPRANVIVEKYDDSNNAHRGGNVKRGNNQELIFADGENMPFKDNEFDYVICCHVMEHVDDPAKFMNELSRVGKRGYIEVPSLLGEHLVPKEAHTWVSLEIDGKIVVVRKSDIGLDKITCDFGELFLHHLRSNSLAYQLLLATEPNLLSLRYEWDGKIDFLISPTDEYHMSHFTKEWTQKYMGEVFQRKGKVKNVLYNLKALLDILTRASFNQIST